MYARWSRTCCRAQPCGINYLICYHPIRIQAVFFIFSIISILTISLVMPTVTIMDAPQTTLDLELGSVSGTIGVASSPASVSQDGSKSRSGRSVLYCPYSCLAKYTLEAPKRANWRFRVRTRWFWRRSEPILPVRVRKRMSTAANDEYG